MIIGNRWHRLSDCVSGAQLLGLQHPVHGFLLQLIANPIAAMSVHDMNRIRAERLRRIEHMRKERAPGERLHWFDPATGQRVD